MDKTQFIEMVAHPDRFTSQDRGWLRAMLAKYPYSSVVGTLTLLADHVYGFDTVDERRAVALSTCNPAVLDRLLGSVTAAEATPAAPEAEETSFDILNEINTFQEVSFKTAPKSVILSKFLQAAPSKEADSELPDPGNHDITDKKSLTPNIAVGTETLAVILEKQGRYDRALAIYENLLAHNPEKSSIFAPRIEELKSLIKSK